MSDVGWVTNGDTQVANELKRLGAVPILHAHYVSVGVQTSITGVLMLKDGTGWPLIREAAAWHVAGSIPLKIVQAVWVKPEMRRYMRMVAYAEGVHPEKAASYYDADGFKLVAESDRVRLYGVAKEAYVGVRFVADPAKEAKEAYVNGVMISDVEVLDEFIKTLREYGLVR